MMVYFTCNKTMSSFRSSKFDARIITSMLILLCLLVLQWPYHHLTTSIHAWTLSYRTTNVVRHHHRNAYMIQDTHHHRHYQIYQYSYIGITINPVALTSKKVYTSTSISSTKGRLNMDATPTTTDITDTNPLSPTPQIDETVFTELTKEQRTFVMGYINKHHTHTFNVPVATTFSPIGIEMAKANVWSGGSYSVVNAILTNVTLRHSPTTTTTSSTNGMEFNVTIQRRSQPLPEYQLVHVPFDAVPNTSRQNKENQKKSYTTAISAMIGDKSGTTTSVSSGSSSNPETPFRMIPTTPMDELVRYLCRMCWIIDQPTLTGKFIQLAIQLGGIGIGKLPENMYLNQVPHNVYVRQWFYDQAAIAVHDAVKLTQRKRMESNRHKVVTLFPETNPSMDSYRIGTLLELIRTVTLRLVLEDRLRVRICVQSSMGVGIFTGVPKQLSGVMKLLQMMDWQSEVGECNEGMIGDYIRFGAIGPDHVMNTTRDTFNDTIVTQYQDDVFLIIAPQSMVGTDTSIIPLLSDMCTAIGTERPVILFNPDLTDKISSGGQQSVRGRQARIDFANTFGTIFHFQNIYVSGTSYFPILGTITKLHPEEPWIAHQRRDYANNEGEVYIPVLAGESMPDGEMILSAFER